MNRIPRSVTIVIPGSYADTSPKIHVIKALRSLFGLGLKEAKDLSENSGAHTLPVTVKDAVDFSTDQMVSAAEWFDRSLSTLKAHGVQTQTDDFRYKAIDTLRVLASEAVLQNDLDFAESLIGMMKNLK